jgi:hypothetical protein
MKVRLFLARFRSLMADPINHELTRNRPPSIPLVRTDMSGENKMDAVQLRQMQAPIKERYKTDPKAALITLKAKGSTDGEGIACKVAGHRNTIHFIGGNGYVGFISQFQ